MLGLLAIRSGRKLEILDHGSQCIVTIIPGFFFRTSFLLRSSFLTGAFLFAGLSLVHKVAAERAPLINRLVQLLVIHGSGEDKKFEAVDGCLQIISEEVLSKEGGRYAPPVFNFGAASFQAVVPTGGTSPQPTKIVATAAPELLRQIEKAISGKQFVLTVADEAWCAREPKTSQ